MPTLCRAFSTMEEARSAVDRLLAAGQPGEEIRVLSGAPERDHRDDDAGSFGGRNGAQEPVGTFAGAERSPRAGMGSFAGDAADRRVGGFGDLDRDTVASYRGGVRHVRVASHRDLRGLLVDAGLDTATADADVEALHHGRTVVLVRTAGLSGERAATALEA
jgi:hypothetical protein